MPKRLLPLIPDALSVLQVKPELDGLIIVTTPRPAPVVSVRLARGRRTAGMDSMSAPWPTCRGRVARCSCAFACAGCAVSIRPVNAAPSANLCPPSPPHTLAGAGALGRCNAISAWLWAEKPGLAWPSVYRSLSARILCCGWFGAFRRLRPSQSA
jgi:hypothetical protein